MQISRHIPSFAFPGDVDRPDRVALADASKRGVGGAAARLAGVHYDDTASAANQNAARQLEDEALRARDARSEAMLEKGLEGELTGELDVQA